MSNVIEDTENLMILALLLGLIGVVIWLVKSKGLQQKAKDFLGGGAGTPGEPEYVSGSENIDRWKMILFGIQPDNYVDEDISPDSGTLIDNYRMPGSAQVQGSVSQILPYFQNLEQTLQNNPGSLPFF